jgi:hypothetical protein
VHDTARTATYIVTTDDPKNIAPRLRRCAASSRSTRWRGLTAKTIVPIEPDELELAGVVWEPASEAPSALLHLPEELSERFEADEVVSAREHVDVGQGGLHPPRASGS